jgi:hypothetical protein
MKGLLMFISFLIFIVPAHKLCGQVSEKYIHQNPFTFSSASSYLDGHIYYNIASNQVWDILSNEQWLVKSDLNLNTVDSIDLFSELNIDSTHFAECMRIKNSGGLLSMIINEVIPDTVTPNQFLFQSHLVLISKDLVVLEHHIIEVTDSRGIQLSDAVMTGSDWFLVGWIVTDTGSRPASVKILSGNLNPLIKIYTDSIFYEDEVFANIELVDSVFLTSIASPFGSTTDRIAILDSNLHLSGLVDMYDPSGEPVYFPNPGFFIQRPQQAPIFLSSAVGDYPFGQNQPYMLFGAGIMDNQYNFARIDTFSFSGMNSKSPNGTINPKPTISAFDYIIPDSSLLVMPGQEMIYAFGYGDRFANDIYLYNYNGLTEKLNWTKIYNNGYTQSSFSPVTALPNNQYLVILNEYNWDKYPYDNLSIHLMILNANGDLISNPELPHHRQRLKAFPNPCSDYVSLEKLAPAPKGTYHYKLWDVSGSLVDEGPISDNGQIYFNQKFKGSHLLSVFKQKELLQSILLNGK